jgi:hypothetical protein
MDPSNLDDPGHNAVLWVQKMTYKLKQLLMSILKGLF